MTTVKKMLISFSAGVIIGVLYAPYKGVKTRRKLKRMGNNIRDSWNTVTDNISDGIDVIKEKVGDIADTSINDMEQRQDSVGDRAGYL